MSILNEDAPPAGKERMRLRLRCRSCGKTKSATSFHVHSERKDGFSSRCRQCDNSRRTDGRKRNPKSRLLAGAKQRASIFNVPFALSLSDIHIPSVCPILGIPLKTHAGSGSGPRSDSPSLDRIVPQHGYVSGNISVISSRANRIKSNATVHELEAILAYCKKATNNRKSKSKK